MEHSVIDIVVDKRSAQTDSANFNTNVAWWPSIPLINKRLAPAVAGVAVLYSEERDVIFHAFKTDDLLASLHSFSRAQSMALAQDQNCRICWKEIVGQDETERLLTDLRLKQHGLQGVADQATTNSSGMEKYADLAQGSSMVAVDVFA